MNMEELTAAMARQDPKKAERIARERIEYLYALAKDRLETNPDASRRYVGMLRDIATKHNVRVTEKKRTFCTECSTLLVSGKTSTTRVRNDRRIVTCGHCGMVKRLGLK